jgi:hypothetical protein
MDQTMLENLYNFQKKNYKGIPLRVKLCIIVSVNSFTSLVFEKYITGFFIQGTSVAFIIQMLV